MAAEVISLSSDSEGDDPAPFVDASLVAAWQQQHPNGAGASAFQAIDLGNDSGEEDSSYSAAADPALNGRALDGEGAAPVAASVPVDNRNDGSASGSSSSSSGLVGGSDGVGSSDSSSSSSEAHGGAADGEPVVGVPVGSDGSPAQAPPGEQLAATPAASGAQAAANPDASGKQERGAAAACAAVHAPAASELGNSSKKAGAGGASAAGASVSAALETHQAAGATGDGGTAESTSPLAASAPLDLAAQAAGSNDAAAPGSEILVRDGSAGDDSNNPAAASDVSAASSSNPTVPKRAADSVEALIEALPPGFVQCPGCPMVYELVPNEAAARGGGGNVATKELPKGANLSRRSAMRHNGRHRFRCPSCSTCFCGACRATPYHIGFDCEGWVAHQAKPKCTYCGDAAEEEPVACGGGDDETAAADGEEANKDQKGGEGALQSPPCCGREECRERANEGCRKKLKCGHACRGPGTAECIPCIEPDCPSAELDGNDYCNVCWTESLLAAPCVKLECGHFVHVSCGREQLMKGRPTARLTFGFMSCPVCRADKVLALHPHLGKCDGIPEQLDLAHQVEELAIQRLRADELPPLKRPSLDSLHAGMRRRMAGLVRHRQKDRHPANWRARGRGGPFPLQIPYPPIQAAGFHPPRRARGAAAVAAAAAAAAPGGVGAAAGAAAGAAGGAQAHPMSPLQLMQGGAPRGDWQLGMGMDWGVPPFAPMIPPPYAHNNVAGAARPGLRVGAAAGAAGVGAAAGGSGHAGGAQQQQQPVSQEEYLNKRRQMLIARADVAMKRKRAVAGGVKAPGAASGARGGLPADPPVAHPRSPLVRERLEQQLEKGKAVLEERRRVRRKTKKNLNEWSLPGDFPFGSKQSKVAAGDAGAAAGAAGAAAGAGAGAGASAAGAAVAVDASVVENVQDAANQPQQGDSFQGRGDDASVRKRDAGEVAGKPAARAAGAVPPPPPRVCRAVASSTPPESLDVGQEELAQGDREGKEGGVGVSAGGGEKAMDALERGGMAGRLEGSEAALAPAVGQPLEDSEMRADSCARKEAPGRDGDPKVLKLATSRHGNFENVAESDSDEPRKLDSNGGGAGADSGSAASAPDMRSAAGADNGKVNDDDGLALDGVGILPWPERALSTRPLHKPAGLDEGDDGDDEALDMEEGVLVVPPPLAKRKREGAGGKGAGVEFESRSKRRPGAGSGAGSSLQELVGVEGKRKRKDGIAPTIAVVDLGDKSRTKVNRGKKRSVVDFDAERGGIGEASPKRVHFGAGDLFGLGLARRVGYRPESIGGEWGALERGAGFSRNKQEEKEAAGAVADAVMAAGAVGGGGVERSEENKDDQRAGGRVDLAAAGMLRLHVSPASIARDRNARVAAAVTAAMRGMAGGGASVQSSNALAASAASDAAAAVAAAPKADGAKEGKGAGASAAGDDDAVQSAELTKEERAKLVKRALKKYSYYQCHSCRKPYFGGLVSCEPAAPPAGGGGGEASVGPGAGAAADAQAAERALADIKPSELLCGKCSAGSGGASCSEHGQEFMEHKCYWCCRKVASYFCGGVMHFCDACHLHGFAAKPKPCLGGAHCLFGGQHPDKAKNGEHEYVLGCGICRPKPEEEE